MGPAMVQPAWINFVPVSMDRSRPDLDVALAICLKPGENLRPALMTEPGTLGRKAGVCETDRGNAVILGQVETNERLKRVLLPVREPCKDEQTGRLDLPVL